jgi:hypothetical protein
MTRSDGMKEAEMIAELKYILSDFIQISEGQSLLSYTLSPDLDRGAFSLNRLHGFTGVGGCQ